MLLKNLLQKVPVISLTGNENIDIKSVEVDSRRIVAGSLFVAVRGTAVDGHTFITKAESQGAVAVVCEELPEIISKDITYVLTPDSHEALGLLASAWYGDPSRELILVGVTGTNGKTTIATLLYKMFRLFGEKVGLLSTVCNYVDDKSIPTSHTTPDPLTLNCLLRQMVDTGCRYAFMEVSSHSVDQRRIAGLEFDGGIFTNLTRDHLDYHKTVDAYLKAKKRFFDDLPTGAFALTNGDEKTGAVMSQNTRASRKVYALNTFADFKGRIIESRLDGTTLEINGRELEVFFVGKFNAYNLLAVYGATCLLGKVPEEVLVNMSMLVPVSGRFQTMHSPQKYTAIVDYAHTPDALTNVLTSIREVVGDKGNVITVVGAGGNRDKGKRPLMAQEAVKWSDKVILTSDNPRFEKPQDILDDMIAGLDSVQRRKTLVIVDRREAIRAATQFATPGDVVLIAGKGHEDYQEVEGVKYHFDDCEEVKRIFDEQ